jgi:acyl-CoA reductase-like NAD-dependent aldehyde dehydrogenase
MCLKITIFVKVLKEEGFSGAIASLIVGSGKTVGEKLINDPSMELVSFTGSTAVGRHVA